ncbi:Isochorismatase hydrolase [Tilletiopsis washingtonensis]|uniref:nicotinamidase n=1 Tax=Tilletiopsis washingtonensis TaxID=58919 RepID=A0A316Z285_9BASI|nr:Isochorismatase hydrolase [Tilletiopsis washingtonensis]PWN95900.1 Isochorismatase hydrolase [Tilletiopsis washingtonensis]
MPAFNPQTAPSRWALLLVDVQHDFVDGSLAVPGADRLQGPLSQLLSSSHFSQICATRDMHPADHISFASTHAGHEAFEELDVPHPARGSVRQKLWPDHCVAGTRGAELLGVVKQGMQEAEQRGVECVEVHKGTDRQVDSYSGFVTAQDVLFSPLAAALFGAHVTRVLIAGVATDFCVRATVLDACRFGLRPLVVLEACAGVEEAGTQRAVRELSEAGAEVVQSVEEALEKVQRDLQRA